MLARVLLIGHIGGTRDYDVFGKDLPREYGYRTFAYEVRVFRFYNSAPGGPVRLRLSAFAYNLENG